jgi:GNAT superfamily N-acetyltransferase
MFHHVVGEFDSSDYERNRRDKRSLVGKGRSHGVLVYCNGQPVGWCQFGPKEELPRIDRRRGYHPVEEGSWRITCIFVARDHRRLGIAREAVRAAVEEMRVGGVRSVEAYPVHGYRSASLLWSGTPALFETFGFSRAASLGKSSSIYRLSLEN